jgi:hypothetical protein
LRSSCRSTSRFGLLRHALDPKTPAPGVAPQRDAGSETPASERSRHARALLKAIITAVVLPGALTMDGGIYFDEARAGMAAAGRRCCVTGRALTGATARPPQDYRVRVLDVGKYATSKALQVGGAREAEPSEAPAGAQHKQLITAAATRRLALPNCRRITRSCSPSTSSSCRRRWASTCRPSSGRWGWRLLLSGMRSAAALAGPARSAHHPPPDRAPLTAPPPSGGRDREGEAGCSRAAQPGGGAGRGAPPAAAALPAARCRQRVCS